MSIDAGLQKIELLENCIKDECIILKISKLVLSYLSFKSLTLFCELHYSLHVIVLRNVYVDIL